MPDEAMGPFDIDAFADHLDHAVEVAEGVYFFTEFSGVTAFETAEGLVLVDTSLGLDGSAAADAIRAETDQPVEVAIYTHGHLDHAYGLGEFLVDGQPDPTVIAHENVVDRFDRYARTAGHNEAVNARQFGGTAEATGDLADEGGSRFRWPDHPPTTLYSDELTLEVGDLTFEIHHARGETDDHSWVYCPERDVLCTGDFHISVAPNAGNPQKVQRYPWEWADALREMAGCDARHLCPGHGEPVVGDPREIREQLLGTADYLETIVDRTLDALDAGSPPHVDVIHEIDLPAPDEPWLEESYDEGEFVARNVLRYFGGWWSGRPSELKPAPRDALATEIASLVGDVDVLADRALDLVEDDPRLACHLADYALEAAPGRESIRDAVAAVYRRRAAAESNLMSANIYASAAAYARAGRPFK